MTAEIAIMNLEAIALAADSAVTVDSADNRKIFSSQNKLFALSSVAPVGILVFGAASFMWLPWETLVKDYRHKYGRQTFPHLDDYAQDFCRYLSEEVIQHITNEEQLRFALSLVGIVYQTVSREAFRRSTEAMRSALAREDSSPPESSQETFETYVDECATELLRRARTAPWVEGVTEDDVRRVMREIRPALRQLRESVFGLGLERNTVIKLNRIAASALRSMIDDVFGDPSPLMSGFAIAGFGEHELFPALSEIHVEGLFHGLMKRRNGRKYTLGPSHSATIVPFAQSDMVFQFMQGVDPEYRTVLGASMTAVLEDYTRAVLEDLGRYSENEQREIGERLSHAHPRIVSDFLERVENIGETEFAGPIMEVVEVLPKDQLAEMAEALVSLTSLKRRVSLQDETVGGPTDVAIITKGDGLVWVRRKHYFSARLNPAYFARTYQGGGRYDAEEGLNDREDP